MSAEPMDLEPTAVNGLTPPPAAPSNEDVPHAFHQNLPPHHKDPVTGIPYITTYAELKAKELYELAMSLKLTSETLFSQESSGTTATCNDEGEENGIATGADVNIEDGDDGFDDDDDDGANGGDGTATSTTRPCRLAALGKQCARLQAQWTGLEQLKYGGFTHQQLCDMLLHLLRLVMCSVDVSTHELYFESVGQVVTVNSDTAGSYEMEDETQQQLKGVGVEAHASHKDKLDRELERPFALTTPTREVLLSIIVHILSNKGPLRAVSNSALYIPGGGNRIRLVLHWKAFLRTLLRTAPYLDEHKQSASPSDSHTRQSNIVKRTSQMIRDARHFFDQRNDATARSVWNMVRTDCLYHSHTHACYRGTIMLYLFQPSRCSAAYYKNVLPQWIECWTNIDRCPEYDFLWLTLLCRARKHVSPCDDYDWGPIRRRLLTHAQYWLQLPIGGAAMDKNFPRAPNPRPRACPPRLKAFTGMNTSYEEGIDFVAKVVKLLVAGLGSGTVVDGGLLVSGISEGTQDVLRFLSFVTPYFNPSNIGSWTFTLGAFLHYFAYELCCRVGAMAGLEALQVAHPALAEAFAMSQADAQKADIPSHEIVALLHALLPLCQQAIYSKNAHVGRAGEAAMLYLVQIDPVRATPAFIDFAARALDTTAIHMSHQAPAALSALTGLIQPSLRSDPSVLLTRLPDILRMSLAGIDSNDQHKCIRTLILYRSLTSWIPVGGMPKTWGVLDKRIGDPHRTDGTRSIAEGLLQYLIGKRESPAYIEALNSLPEFSLMKQNFHSEDLAGAELQGVILEEASSAMSDWAIEFLERVFGLLRASGEREKRSKSSSGIASRHSSADVHQARNFSRVLTETLMQVFAAMDQEIHEIAVRAVERFICEETLSFAAKDAAIICQAASAARLSIAHITSPGLDGLIGMLTEDLYRHSTRTQIYRIRCLAGAVKSAGSCVLKHRLLLAETIRFALGSDDRHLFKTGCKLLRHTLATLSESYPISGDSRPRVYIDEKGRAVLGKSAQLHGDQIRWHVPDARCIEFFAELVVTHLSSRLDALCTVADGMAGLDRSTLLNAPDLHSLRLCLRIIRYTVRGGSGLLLDLEPEGTDDSDVVPYERCCFRLLDVAEVGTRRSLLRIRGHISGFLVALSSVIGSDTLYPDAAARLPDDDPYRKSLPLIGSDAKVCRECCDISLLLLTRRGAAFRSQEGRTIWKAQKQLATDFSLCAEVDRLVEVFQMGNLYGSPSHILYKDGEDAGKTISRRLLVSRVQLFHNLLQRNASFQVPRRLRRFEREQKWSRAILFKIEPTLSEMIASRELMLKTADCRPLDLYDGIIDGLFALCCNSNSQIRAAALSVIDYALTRFGWILAPRVRRLLSGLALQDKDIKGKFGIPSCAELSKVLNKQGQRKRLAESIKGVCSILSLPRSVRLMLGSWNLRSTVVVTLCCTDELMSLLPTDEFQKIIHYLQAIFSPFRSSIYVLPATHATDADKRMSCISFLLGVLAEKNTEPESAVVEDGDGAEGGKGNWKKLLFAAWFLLNFVDGDVISDKPNVREAIWSTCFSLIENNMGQPLQKVALGILGKLVSMLHESSDKVYLVQRMSTETFSKILGRALVFDRKEDTGVGGGHKSQWSSGVENIVRDAARHLAPKSLFPFQRTSQSLGSFKVAHCQLLESILSKVDDAQFVLDVSISLLAVARELTSTPPSEDQRNQQITAAEIFAGVFRSCVRSSTDSAALWAETLLPHLDDVLAKIPFSLCGAYFDALRYALQFSDAATFLPLITWLVDKVENSLWQPRTSDSGSNDSRLASSATGAEGFTTQTKWLFLMSAVIIEMDEFRGCTREALNVWYQSALLSTSVSDLPLPLSDDWTELRMIIAHKFMPLLVDALGHPFDSCRDHVARALFWVCYSHRRLTRSACISMTGIDKSAVLIGDSNFEDPSVQLVSRIMSLRKEDTWTFIDRCNALNTSRRFISYCVHLGEAKFEYSEYVIRLLPLIFDALNSASEDEVSDGVEQAQAESITRRALESAVIKAYRYMISDVSITAVVSYFTGHDIPTVLDAIENACKHEKWQVRQGGANFLRCFQYAHKFLLGIEDAERATRIAVGLLADERREVSSAGMAALVGILAASSAANVARQVKHYTRISDRSRMRKLKKGHTAIDVQADITKEQKRSCDQQVAVFFLVASVMSQPYETPAYVPEALEAISKHSFERSAPLGVRDIVKKCCAEYKRTHMSDNWDMHRSMFSNEQLEAFEDVTSTPHYYA